MLHCNAMMRFFGDSVWVMPVVVVHVTYYNFGNNCQGMHIFFRKCCERPQICFRIFRNKFAFCEDENHWRDASLEVVCVRFSYTFFFTDANNWTDVIKARKRMQHILLSFADLQENFDNLSQHLSDGARGNCKSYFHTNKKWISIAVYNIC